MIIKKAKPKDASLLYSLEKKLFLAENFPLSRASFAYHIRNSLILTAEVEGELAGYILVLIKRANAKLYSIGVGSTYRDSGIAKKLLEAAVVELLLLGFKRLLLEVRVDNVIAISLYKKMGFSIKKELKAFYLDGCNAYLMESDINIVR